MTSSAKSLPSGLVPARELDLCTNVFVGVRVPIAVDGFPVLLIGKGDVPSVWIAAPEADTPQRWTYVVAGSRSLNAGVQVSINKHAKQVTVLAGKVIVLKARMSSADSVAITHIDLRPVGLLVTGDQYALQVAGTQLRGNRFENVETGIALGKG